MKPPSKQIPPEYHHLQDENTGHQDDEPRHRIDWTHRFHLLIPRGDGHALPVRAERDAACSCLDLGQVVQVSIRLELEFDCPWRWTAVILCSPVLQHAVPETSNFDRAHRERLTPLLLRHNMNVYTYRKTINLIDRAVLRLSPRCRLVVFVPWETPQQDTNREFLDMPYFLISKKRKR